MTSGHNKSSFTNRSKKTKKSPNPQPAKKGNFKSFNRNDPFFPPVDKNQTATKANPKPTNFVPAGTPSVKLPTTAGITALVIAATGATIPI